MSADNGGLPRLTATPLAVLNILVGFAGGAAALGLAVFAGGLSVHSEDGLPPLGLAISLGLLGVAGVLLLARGRRGAAVVAGLAAVAASGGIASAFWRDANVSGMWAYALVIAPVALVALAEVVYLLRARS